VRRLAPAGTLAHDVLVQAAAVAAVAAVCALVAVAAGAWVARGPSVERAPRRSRFRRVLVWELAALAAACALFVAVEHGGGLAGNGDVGAHPRLPTLCVPLLLAAGLGGLATRAVREPLRAARSRRTAVFLALRRLAAARSLLVLLVVTAAVAFAALVFAVVLQRSLATNSAEKAYVANGADAQGVVAVSAVLPRSATPATKVVELFNVARLDEPAARPVEVLAVDPRGLRRVLRWRWQGDPDAALARLAASRARLPAIAVGAGGADGVWLGGRREPLDVVASLHAFPGMLAGQPLLVVPLPRLRAVAPHALDGALGYVWVRGEGRAAARALARLPVAATYVTTVDDFLRRVDLSTASRSYGYLRLIAIGAAVIAFVALALYLHARARSQLVTSELLARMGLTRRRQAASVALEAAALVGFAAVVGGLAGVVSAHALVHTIDPLPQYAPAAFPVVPWAALAAGLAAVTVAAAAAGAAAVLFARGDLAEAVRVA
jgi:putative ABC transport system permease protein